MEQVDREPAKKGFWSQLGDSLQKELSFDGTDWTQQRFHKRIGQGLDADEPRITNMAAKHPLLTRVRDITMVSPEEGRESRKKMGMETEETPTRRAGQLLGAVGADLVQDKTRSFWWLLNAMQAASNVVTESIYGQVAPDLYVSDIVLDKNEQVYRPFPDDRAKTLKAKDYDPQKELERIHQAKLAAANDGLAYRDDKDFNLKAGYSRHNSSHDQKEVILPSGRQVTLDTHGAIQKRRYPGGHVATLMIPQGFAVNTALGLMTPFGGAKGYEAALPDPEDPSKTSNVIGEIAAKYFLGRTGNLLPYHEFVKVRPDVSRSEYEAYKAFKYDKSADIDLSDGDFTIPTGVLKGTMEGIHGPEIQFLGRSLPLTTGVIPTASSILGGVLAAQQYREQDLIKERKRRRDMIKRGTKYEKKPTFVGVKKMPKTNLVLKMMQGSLAGMTAGMIGGNLLEAERQRRNMRENEQKTVPLNPESTTVGF